MRVDESGQRSDERLAEGESTFRKK